MIFNYFGFSSQLLVFLLITSVVGLLGNLNNGFQVFFLFLIFYFLMGLCDNYANVLKKKQRGKKK